MANQYEQFNVANPYQLQQQELDRRQKMAEILQQQAFEPVQAGSYQGIQAPISPVQGLAKVLQMYLSNKNQEGIKTEQKALGEQYRAEQPTGAANDDKFHDGEMTQAQDVTEVVLGKSGDEE